MTATNDQHVEGSEPAALVNDRDACRTRCVTALIAVEPSDAACGICGRSIRWMRTDAKFCSSACRQRAYRERKAVAHE
jgi:hypothetical protein